MGRIVVVPLALVVISLCLWYLERARDQEEVPTERSSARYVCRRCGKEVTRGAMLRYIYERMLCDQCWLDDGARLRPVDSSVRSRRYATMMRATNPLVMLSVSRGGALVIFLHRRRG